MPAKPTASPPDLCATCRYFQGGASGMIDSEQYGNCRRFPPQVEFVMQSPEHLTHEEQFRARWPAVKPSDWCGEYKPV